MERKETNVSLFHQRELTRRVKQKDMNFQTLFIENESRRAELIEAAENAASEAGYSISVNSDGSFSYDDEESYNSQGKIYAAIGEAVAEIAAEVNS